VDITKNDPPNQGGPERAKVEMQDKSSAPVVNDTESDLRMQNISEFSGEANDIVSDNQTAPVGAIGLGMAASRIDVNSSLNKSRDPYPRKGDIFSYEARSDEMVNSDNESGRHNINALNAGKPNCKSTCFSVRLSTCLPAFHFYHFTFLPLIFITYCSVDMNDPTQITLEKTGNVVGISVMTSQYDEDYS